jgi:hypothetical protein
MDETRARSALLDRYGVEIDRDPASITRSTNGRVDYQDPAATRDAVAAVLGAGFTHIVLSLGAPYPDKLARWVADQTIPSLRYMDLSCATLVPGSDRVAPGVKTVDRRRPTVMVQLMETSQTERGSGRTLSMKGNVSRMRPGSSPVCEGRRDPRSRASRRRS